MSVWQLQSKPEPAAARRAQTIAQTVMLDSSFEFLFVLCSSFSAKHPLAMAGVACCSCARVGVHAYDVLVALSGACAEVGRCAIHGASDRYSCADVTAHIELQDG